MRRAPLPDFRPFAWALPEVDGGFLNVLTACSTARNALRASSPDVILASGPPFHTFISAYLLARRYRAALVLEYRDEWTECPFDFVAAGPWDRRWETKCLATADLVIFTTRSQRDHYLSVFPTLRADRCRVIPNGWEPADWPGEAARSELATNGGRCILSFVGNLGNHSLPDDFLSSLAAAVGSRPALAGRIGLRFIGQKSPSAQQQLDAGVTGVSIELVAQVPKCEACRLMTESRGLLLINGPSLERYIPGKLYEYVAAMRPILVYGEGGEVASLIRELDAGFVVPSGDPESLADALSALAAADPRMDPEGKRKAWLSRHTRRRLALETLDAIRRL